MKYGILLFFWISLAFGNECEVKRAAFDIGSGATKMKVATVDICLDKIVKMLAEDSVPVPFKEDLQKSAQNKLSAGVIKQGILALRKLKQKAQSVGATEFYASATSAFRTASNGEEAIKTFSKETQIQIFLINQKLEGKLGFAAASSVSPNPMDKTIVWDIGGGSMQIVAEGKNGLEVYEGKIASVSFKDHIVEVIEKRTNVTTPNPINKTHYDQAYHDARVVAKFAVPPELKEKIKAKDYVVVGIGGVHSHSIGKRIGVKNKESYTSQRLEATLPSLLNMTDEALESPYAATEVSNMILVKAFMDELAIEKVVVGEINLADGLLLSGKKLIQN